MDSKIKSFEWEPDNEVLYRLKPNKTALTWSHLEEGTRYASLWIDDHILIARVYFRGTYAPKDFEVLRPLEQLARIRYGLE